MATNGRTGREKPGRTRPRSVARLHREGDGRRRSRSAMDDELLPCGNRNPLPQTPQADHRHWREVGDLSGLSRVEGLHVTLRPDLDQLYGEPARLNEHRRIAG